MSYATLPGGVTVYYTDEGRGDALLFVHGWTCDSNDFLCQLAHFRSTHRVVAADLRGHGRSSVPRDGYEARVFARDLIELLDRLAVDTCVAIGHSLGGLVVSALAVEYPERVRAVVCLDPSYGVADQSAKECRALVELLDGPDWPEALARSFPDWEGVSTPPFFRELHVRRMLAMDRSVVRATFQGIFTGADPLGFRARSESYLAGRKRPVLSVHALDGAERAEWEARHFTQSSSRFMHLPTGHWVQHDAPELTNQLIADWLRALS